MFNWVNDVYYSIGSDRKDIYGQVIEGVEINNNDYWFNCTETILEEEVKKQHILLFDQSIKLIFWRMIIDYELELVKHSFNNENIGFKINTNGIKIVNRLLQPNCAFQIS